MKIFIDAGHGGKDPGAVGANGLHEANVNLNLALKLGKLLVGRGINVVYSRQSDVFIDLGERPKKANTEKADYFISLHCNSSTSPQANGTETFAHNAKGEGAVLAGSVQRHLVSALGTANRGVKYENFAVLRLANIPAILIELAFISNSGEEIKLTEEDFINSAAHAIATGVFEHTGMQPSVKPTVNPTVEDCTQDFVWRGIIKDKAKWDYLGQHDTGIFVLLKDSYKYIIANGGSVKNRLTDIDAALAVLSKQGIISNTERWKSKIKDYPELHWLIVKIADYIN